MRERDLDRLFVAECKRRGIITYKTSSYGCRGFADRTLFGPGHRAGYVELKAYKATPTKAQRDFAKHCVDSHAFYRLLTASKGREDTLVGIKLVLNSYLSFELFHPDYGPL